MATVDFTISEFADFLGERGLGSPYSMVQGFYDSMLGAGPRRRAEEVMQRANELLGGHGVEAIRVEGAYVDNYHFDIVATYVNMGDTYNGTIVHDSENNSFHLTTYGDWLEQYENEYPPEHACPECGQMADDFDMRTGLCPGCRREREDELRSATHGVIVGPRFEVEIIAKDPAGPPVWPGTADWSLSPGQDRDNPHLMVQMLHQGVAVGHPLYTTAEMLRQRTLGNRLYSIGSLSWIQKLTDESVGRALVALDAFIDQLDAIEQEEIYRRER